MSSAPSFAEPFPAGLRSASGCFALETDQARIASFTNKDRYAPLLYVTQLRTRGPCKDLLTHAQYLDQQCHWERAAPDLSTPGRTEQGGSVSVDASLETTQVNGSTSTVQHESSTTGAATTSSQQRESRCEEDQGTRLLGQKVCDFYEGSEGAGWRNMFLAECDCLKRDHVPQLAEVVAACRAKAAAQALAVSQYNAQLSAGANVAMLNPPRLTVDAEMCDAIEAEEAVRVFPLDDRDYFNHLLSRYLTRGVWKEVLSKFGDAHTVESGFHPFCTYEPCRDGEDPVYFAPFSETQRAKGSCKNVAECQARITRQFVRGTVRVRDNVFRVECSGGRNCQSENMFPKCSNRGLCQPDGSCDCDDGWTGEDCSIEVRQTLPDDKPRDITNDGNNNQSEAPPPLGPAATDTKEGTSPVVIVLLVALAAVWLWALFKYI
jgi:hypothetical protein